MPDELMEVRLALRNQAEFVRGAEQAAGAVKDVGDASDKTGKQMEQQATRGRKQAGSLDKLAGKAKLLALGIAGLGVVSLRSAASYEQAMNVFQVTSGATDKQMKQAGKTAVALGNDIGLPGVSAKDAADSMNELAKGGFNAKESMQAARGVLLLGQAAQVDFATSTQIVARELKAFGRPARDASKFVDTLAAASLKSTVGIQEIADGMAYTGTTAHALGIGFTDASSALAILNDRGLVGAKAGSALNQMLVRLVNPTGKAADVMRQLGLITKDGANRFFDAQGRFIGMRKATQLYSRSVQNLNPQLKAQARVLIFGREGQRAANELLQEGTGTWDKYRKAVGASGSAQKLAGAQAKGLAGAIEAAKNAGQTLALVFGTALAPAALAVLNPVSKLFTWLSKYPEDLKLVVLLLGGLATAIWVVNAATKAWAAVNLFLETTLAPWILIPALIAAVVVGIVILYRHSKTFRAIVQGALHAVTAAFDALKKAALAAFDWIKQNWPLLVGILGGPLGLAIAVIVTHFKQVKAFVGGVIDWIKKRIRGLLNWVKGLPGKLVGGILNAVPGGGLVKKGLHAAGFADGGVVPRTGSILVGERGPEIIHASAGTLVQPLQHSERAARDVGIQRPLEIIVPVKIGEREVARAVAHVTADKLARR